ncbi:MULTISPECIES: sensor domain-containing protein [unclassified Mycobacterium]|uniref:sensor domain-containing protein n=1 Tax=unclassified Mycobacterium TaxID=2642494 RepID=UPI0006DD1737|nr:MULTISPECIES: sensor domain-containing protein [unclassified Mycobacterium]
MVRRQFASVLHAAVCALTAGCTTTVGGSAAPADNHGPLSQAPVAVTALDGLLLDDRKIYDILGGALRIRYRTQDMWDSSATFSDKSCLAMAGPAQQAVYADTGWTAVRGERLDDSYDNPMVRNYSVDQAVIAYPTARQANAFYEASARRWSACANRRFVDHPPGQPEVAWAVADSHAVGGTLSTSEEQQGSEDGWRCQRALTARNNVVIDVATCGSFLPGGSAVDIAQQVAAAVVTR